MKNITINELTINNLNAIELGIYIKCLLNKDDISFNDIRKEMGLGRVYFTNAKNKLIEYGYITKVFRNRCVFWIIKDELNEPTDISLLTQTNDVDAKRQEDLPLSTLTLDVDVNSEMTIDADVKRQFETFEQVLTYNGLPTIMIDIMNNGAGMDDKRNKLYNDYSEKYYQLMNDNFKLWSKI